MNTFSEHYSKHGFIGGINLSNTEMFDKGGIIKPTMEELVARIASLSKKSKDELAEATGIPKTDNLERWYPKVASYVLQYWNNPWDRQPNINTGNYRKLIKKLSSSKDEDGQRTEGTWGEYEKGELVNNINQIKVGQIILIKERSGATSNKFNIIKKVGKVDVIIDKNDIRGEYIIIRYSDLTSKHDFIEEFYSYDFVKSESEFNSSGADAVIVYSTNK